MSKLEQLAIKVPKGKYIAAVSGGVDSMVLLDILRQLPEIELVVAHFDHGIRDDSHKDAELVAEYCKKHRLKFVLGHGELGSDASEATARQARYQFLNQQMQEHGAAAVITAHHRDDLLETVLINLLRGTKRRGLTSLKSRHGLLRPLLDISKSKIIDYAESHDLAWREDSTNQDQNYLRNYLRHSIIPKLSQDSKAKLFDAIERQRKLEPLLESTLKQVYERVVSDSSINRQRFVQLPHAVSCEVIREFMEHLRLKNIDSSQIERVVRFCKTAAVGKTYELTSDIHIKSQKQQLEFVSPKI